MLTLYPYNSIVYKCNLNGINNMKKISLVFFLGMTSSIVQADDLQRLIELRVEKCGVKSDYANAVLESRIKGDPEIKLLSEPVVLSDSTGVLNNIVKSVYKFDRNPGESDYDYSLRFSEQQLDKCYDEIKSDMKALLGND